jgi:hypothetical protein
MEGTGIEDENHALLMGNIVGALLDLANKSGVPTKVEPIMDKGDMNYTNKITIARPSGTYTITVEKD